MTVVAADCHGTRYDADSTVYGHIGMASGARFRPTLDRTARLNGFLGRRVVVDA